MERDTTRSLPSRSIAIKLCEVKKKSIIIATFFKVEFFHIVKIVYVYD